MPTRRDFLKGAAGVAGGLTLSTVFVIEHGENTSLGEFADTNILSYLKNPGDYVDTDNAPEHIQQFMNAFDHDTDPLYGLYDHVGAVSETVADERGDCTDYSAVAASWALNNGMSPELILYAPEGTNYGHVNVYAGGDIYDYSYILSDTSPNAFAQTRSLTDVYSAKFRG